MRRIALALIFVPSVALAAGQPPAIPSPPQPPSEREIALHVEIRAAQLEIRAAQDELAMLRMQAQIDATRAQKETAPAKAPPKADQVGGF